jgi:TPR repeat protein
VASGADGLAGLSDVSGGGGAVAQPAKRLKTINGIEYRFIFCRGDRFSYWYEQAANNGNQWGMVNLGYMYLHGRGVEQNDKMAIQWYQKAKDAGNGPAKKVAEEALGRLQQPSSSK